GPGGECGDGRHRGGPPTAASGFRRQGGFMSAPTRSPYDPYDSHDPHAEPYPASASSAVPYPRSYFDDPYEPYEASAYSDARYDDRYHDYRYYGEQDGGHGYVQQPLYEAPDDLHGVPDDHREPPRDTAADPDPDPVR